MKRKARIWGALVALAVPSLAAALPAVAPRRVLASEDPARLSKAVAPRRVTPALELLAATLGTDEEVPASPFEPPGPPEGRPPTAPPGRTDPPNPPGRPPDRPPGVR